MKGRLALIALAIAASSAAALYLHRQAGAWGPATTPVAEPADGIRAVSVTPAQRLDKTSFFDPGAVFVLDGRGLRTVEVFAVPMWGDGPVMPLGAASSTLGVAGETRWTIALPPDLEASDVYATATDSAGKTTRSPGVGRVRPRSTLQ